MSSIDDPLADHPWPSKGDRLFPPNQPEPGHLPPGHEQLDAYGNVYRIQEGYYQTGDMLSAALLNPANRYQVNPGVIFPMAFCYRHYLELVLKALIPCLADLSRQPIQIELVAEHSLMKLWNEFRRHARDAFPDHPDNEPTGDIVERCVNELNQIDATSQAFRYPTDKKGESVGDQLPTVDVERMRKTMANLHSYFDGCYADADRLLDLQSDINSMGGE